MINRFKKFIKNKEIINLYKTNYKKNVLISYIVYPLKFGVRIKHNNQLEIKSLVKVLKELKYNVDVVFYLSAKDLDWKKYDLIFGFGTPFLKASKKNKQAKKIFYGTGSNPEFQNKNALKRVEEVQNKTNINMIESVRISKFNNPEQYILADSLILLGSKFSFSTYKKYKNKAFFINTFYNPLIKTLKVKPIKKEDQKKSFLYFTSNGAIHRNLDLLLEIFEKREDLTLYISSNLKNEKKFLNYYKKILKKKNIKYLGFTKINSKKFNKLINKCAFSILPTISEGQSTSMVNLISCGLIPIMPESAGINIDSNMIEISKLNSENIIKSIDNSQNLSIRQINKMRKNNRSVFIKKYKISYFEKNIKNLILKQTKN